MMAVWSKWNSTRSVSDTPIQYFSEDTSFELQKQDEVSQWLLDLISNEGAELHDLNYIFCSDEVLHQMNVEHLDHDTLTDVITFDLSDNQLVEGEIYLSVDRVKDNASTMDLVFVNELHRVMAHGLLHLLGYGDKTPEEKQQMRAKEDYYLNLRTFL